MRYGDGMGYGKWTMGNRREERYTFFTGGIQVNALGQMVHVEVLLHGSIGKGT